MDRDIDNLISDYTSAILTHRQEVEHGDPKIANRAFDLAIKYYKEIKKTEIGKNGLKILLNNEEPSIRLAVATHLLPFYEKEAIEVLTKLGEDKGGLSFEARLVIKGWQKGTLKKYLLSL